MEVGSRIEKSMYMLIASIDEELQEKFRKKEDELARKIEGLELENVKLNATITKALREKSDAVEKCVSYCSLFFPFAHVAQAHFFFQARKGRLHVSPRQTFPSQRSFPQIGKKDHRHQSQIF